MSYFPRPSPSRGVAKGMRSSPLRAYWQLNMAYGHRFVMQTSGGNVWGRHGDADDARISHLEIMSGWFGMAWSDWNCKSLDRMCS